MCLILFAYKVSGKYPLILAANRDEFYARPTLAMHFWEDFPHILAGKDLEQGGTWFGVQRNKTFAALTNFRNPAALKPNARSRGEIIIEFLNSKKDPASFINDLNPRAHLYNGFNLILGNLDHLFWYSNLTGKIESVTPGIHGLSNRFLNTAWPKVELGKKKLNDTLKMGVTQESLLSLLNDRTVPEDKLLPQTGVGIEWERMLSPLFIESHTYGTRSSIAMAANRDGCFEITERTYFKNQDPKDVFFVLPA